jgi:hypothetical protein
MRLAITLSTFVLALQLHAKPLKVFILAGQSNMEGHAKIETFDYIGDDPATAPLLKMMRGPTRPAACVRSHLDLLLTGKYDGSANGEGTGKLTAGYGARGTMRRSRMAKSARSSLLASRWMRR